MEYKILSLILLIFLIILISISFSQLILYLIKDKKSKKNIILNKILVFDIYEEGKQIATLKLNNKYYNFSEGKKAVYDFIERYDSDNFIYYIYSLKLC